MRVTNKAVNESLIAGKVYLQPSKSCEAPVEWSLSPGFAPLSLLSVSEMCPAPFLMGSTSTSPFWSAGAPSGSVTAAGPQEKPGSRATGLLLRGAGCSLGSAAGGAAGLDASCKSTNHTTKSTAFSSPSSPACSLNHLLHCLRSLFFFFKQMLCFITFEPRVNMKKKKGFTIMSERNKGRLTAMKLGQKVKGSVK